MGTPVKGHVVIRLRHACEALDRGPHPAFEVFACRGQVRVGVGNLVKRFTEALGHGLDKGRGTGDLTQIAEIPLHRVNARTIGACLLQILRQFGEMHADGEQQGFGGRCFCGQILRAEKGPCRAAWTTTPLYGSWT